MKKFISMALALILCVCFTVPAFADTSSSVISGVTSPNTAAIDVNGAANVTGGAPVYCVVVTWSGPSFVWTENIGSWNTSTLSYDSATAGSWVLTSGENTNKIGIANRSNMPISATISATVEEDKGVHSVAASYDVSKTASAHLVVVGSQNSTMTLYDAETGEVAASFVLSLINEPSEDFISTYSIGNSTKIISLTVTISTAPADSFGDD